MCFCVLQFYERVWNDGEFWLMDEILAEEVQ